ncbi:MAG: hypothetical protein MUF14_02520 [Hyphomonadaceae bacterium]|nr:hypothetical protein [Hyphomonadaceae bacterium]
MRHWWIGLVVLASTGWSGLAAAQSRDAARERPLADALPFYERYLQLPASTRDGFVMQYSLLGQDGGQVPAVTLIRDGRRTPLQLGPGGRLTPPSDLATLRATRVSVAGRASLTMNLVPVIPLSRRVPVAAVNNALGDYRDALRAAGPMALAAPRLRGVAFPGVASGQAELADGRLIALPRDRAGDPVFRPDDRAMRGAVAIVLPAVPTRVEFSQ